jgi:ABC-type polysaccharide/polyol phosphate transport system ATPase subunit
VATAAPVRVLATTDRPVVIEVRGVRKTFHVPRNRVDTLKERVTHRGARGATRELHALRGIDFDVHQGEFFGIVGRNGSGKSTLLKVLASIYRADAGTVRMAGRLAPFIELGVGFNPELSSRENVTLNGVLMGLSRREARGRLDRVLEFAGLREFADLKLKNYSSGMMVRLAFAVMVEADADIMLIDEVLAVGDAAFAQKCMDVFRDKRRAGRTIVLVTHDMATVQSFCDRAMVIHDGEQVHLGDPEEAALRYFRLNFGGEADEHARPGGVPDVNVRIHDAWLEDGSGRRVDNVEQGQPLHLTIVFEARRPLEAPVFSLQFVNADGQVVFGFNRGLEDGRERLEAGQRVRVGGRIENPLRPGRYGVVGWISRNRTQGDLALHVLRLLEFGVYGTRLGPGAVEVDADVRAVAE